MKTSLFAVNRNLKLAIAGCLLGLGLLAAFMFRKPASPLESGTGASQPQARRGAQAEQSESGSAVLAVPARARPQFTSPNSTQRSASAGTRVVPRGDGLASGDSQPPDLAPSYGGSRVSITEPIVRRAEGAPLPQATAAAPPQRTHQVVDGDTLAKLAEQYLGNSDREGEIFALNRDQLSAPDLLPIGKVLKLPPRERTTLPLVRDTADSLDLVPIPSGAFNRRGE